MKKSLVLLLLLTFFILIFTCGCANKNPKPSASFDSEDRFLASVKIMDLETKGEIFFDDEKRLHFLHADPTSPLFGMEEIIDGKRIVTNFMDLEYQRDFTSSGTAILKSIFDVLENKNGKTVKENGEITEKFNGEDYSFTLSSSIENPQEKKIYGNGWDSTFEITFLPAA